MTDDQRDNSLKSCTLLGEDIDAIDFAYPAPTFYSPSLPQK
jgi:hypothetical protein